MVDDGNTTYQNNSTDVKLIEFVWLLFIIIIVIDFAFVSMNEIMNYFCSRMSVRINQIKLRTVGGAIFGAASALIQFLWYYNPVYHRVLIVTVFPVLKLRTILQSNLQHKPSFTNQLTSPIAL